ncbi:hypothetical protein AHAS_Ahas19G0354700 [Arachis hypogaea]
MAAASSTSLFHASSPFPLKTHQPPGPGPPTSLSRPNPSPPLLSPPPSSAALPTRTSATKPVQQHHPRQLLLSLLRPHQRQPFLHRVLLPR